MSIKNFYKIRILFIALFLVFLINACGKKTVKNSEQQFVEKRHKILDQLVETDPQNVIIGQIVFNRFIHFSDLNKMITNTGSQKILYIYYGSPKGLGGGGYTPNNSEDSLGESIEGLKKGQLEYFESQINLEKKLIESTKDNNTIKVTQESITRLEMLKQEFENEGIFVYGMVIEAPVKDLKKIRDVNIELINIVNPLLDKYDQVRVLPPH